MAIKKTDNKNEKFLFDIEGYKIYSTTNAQVKKDEVLMSSRSGSTYVIPIQVMREFLNELDNDLELQQIFGQTDKEK
ncbi:hypothetical protein [Virgibacillus sp. DJP39]|uniref:hypothetical protein n=1 Tax=Virgibacillus sp. DJP39 TaxID=3409790 RepID=UPI003BB50A9E